jgi:kinesin family protein 4/21/27
MNAQSSRSHAIFSLTLIQRKYRGSGLPQRSSSPLPPNGRSPSRLARPGSILAGSSGNRVSSPTFGRPGTPGISSAMARTSMLRPASSLGHHDARGSLDDDNGEWVTVVSKFHFVDLAGSERVSVPTYFRPFDTDSLAAQANCRRG